MLVTKKMPFGVLASPDISFRPWFFPVEQAASKTFLKELFF
jgi:hypothetical protein